MKTLKFKELFKYAPKSRFKASEGDETGNFAFYTSSSIVSKRIQKAQYFNESLIFGNGGSANIHYSNEPFGTTSHCFVATPKFNNINTKYVYYYLLGNINLLERGFKGAGLKNISPYYIENLDIPVLPFETQNKIVSILDKANALVAKREQSIQLLDELLKATFLDMFGDPVVNNKGWKYYKMSKISESRLGKMRDEKTIVGNNLKKYLRNTNVQWFNFKLDNLLEMDFNDKDKLEFNLKYGDVLMCEGGEIGRCAIWKNEIEDCYFQKALHRIRLDTKTVLPEYFVFMFWLYASQGGLLKYMGAATISHLTGEKLKRMELPIPPLQQQAQFKNFVNSIDLSKNLLTNSLSKLKNLFNSTLQRAFNGDLNFNIDAELDSLLNEIDLQKKENDLSKIVGDEVYLQRLIDKLNTQEFKEKDLYNKAKHGVFQLLKEDRKVTQVYNEKDKSIQLALK